MSVVVCKSSAKALTVLRYRLICSSVRHKPLQFPWRKWPLGWVDCTVITGFCPSSLKWNPRFWPFVEKHIFECLCFTSSPAVVHFICLACTTSSGETAADVSWKPRFYSSHFRCRNTDPQSNKSPEAAFSVLAENFGFSTKWNGLRKYEYRFLHCSDGWETVHRWIVVRVCW